MPELTRDGDVFVLHLGDGENRLRPELIAEVGEMLDRVEATGGPKALVTAATGKFWSNGFDLEWLVAAGAEQQVAFLASIRELLARVLVLPLPTVAAVQGHCFAAAAMLSLAHDFRVMRADRGWFCLPEVDLRLPFSTGMSALIRARLPSATAHAAMTTGRRYGGDEALAAGIADQVADEGKVLATALATAQPLAGKASPVLGQIKAVMYEDVVNRLRDPGPLPDFGGADV